MAPTGTAEKSANAEKTAAVAEIAEAFRGASAALLTEYRGLTVGELSTLRRALGSGTKYAVVKNTLTKIAAADAGLTGLDEMLAGPTAIAFVTGDPVEAAKGLRDFAREHPLLVVKGGVLDGRSLTPAEITRLADLESREVLLAKLAGAMKGSLSQAVGLFAAPLAQVARLAAALEAKAQADPSVLRGGAGTPAEPSPEPEPARTDAAPAAVADETPAEASAEAPVDPSAETLEQVVAGAEAPQPEPEPAAAEPAADGQTADSPTADSPTE